MKVIVVADGDPPLLAPMREAASKAGSKAGLSWVATAPSEAATTIVDAARGDGCVVVGVGTAAGPALETAAEHGGVRGFVSLHGQLGESQLELLAEWPQLPVLAIAKPADRVALACAVSAYLAAQHPASDLMLDEGAPHDDVVAWIAGRMAAEVEVTEVSFPTIDGWIIHGTRRVPVRDEPVPGVVLLHTGRSDRAAYARTEQLLADSGLAVLNVDWRGRGESTNLGTYFELDAETKAAAWRDAAAAFEHLAADPRIDASRLAAIGCVHGAEYAVRAAWRDRRVRAVVVLTGYRPHEPEEAQLLLSGDVAVLYVTATGHTITTEAMRDLHRRAPRGSAQMIEYPGSALGYQLFDQDPSLEPRIAAWLAEALA
jgi:dienelactone hydrolase